MPQNPEQSDPIVELSVEPLSDPPRSSGVRKVPGTSSSNPPQPRFTMLPPTSGVAKRNIPFSDELDPADPQSDVEFLLPIDPDFDEFMEETGNKSISTIPPTGASVELIESEIQRSVANIRPTPTVQTSDEIPSFSIDRWESASDLSLQLFLELGIDLQPPAQNFQQKIENSRHLDYRHELLLIMMMLRDVTSMMEAYFREDTLPDDQDPLGSFLLESLKFLKLRKSLHPGMSTADAFNKQDKFRQICTVMKPSLDELDKVLVGQDKLNLTYQMMLLNWQLEQL